MSECWCGSTTSSHAGACCARFCAARASPPDAATAAAAAATAAAAAAAVPDRPIERLCGTVMRGDTPWLAWLPVAEERAAAQGSSASGTVPSRGTLEACARAPGAARCCCCAATAVASCCTSSCCGSTGPLCAAPSMAASACATLTSPSPMELCCSSGVYHLTLSLLPASTASPMTISARCASSPRRNETTAKPALLPDRCRATCAAPTRRRGARSRGGSSRPSSREGWGAVPGAIMATRERRGEAGDVARCPR